MLLREVFAIDVHLLFFPDREFIGNDSRFPSSTCGAGNKMRWDGSAWVCEPDDTTDSTKVAKAGDTMTGALNLPADGFVVGTDQLVMSGGNVGIGTDSPGALLDVNGTVRFKNWLTLLVINESRVGWVNDPAFYLSDHLVRFVFSQLFKHLSL